jgi:RNA-binding protein 39
VRNLLLAKKSHTFVFPCGQVTDVRIIKDAQTRRSKGIAYVEFEKQESCPMAVAKSGQMICGFPVVIQASQAEKNIAAKQAALGVSGFVSIHFLVAGNLFSCVYHMISRFVF